MSEFPHLFQPIQVNGLHIRNRIVMAPMNTDYADPEGEVTPELIDYYVERARGGAGLIITSAAVVDPMAKKRAGELCIYADRYIPALTRLAKVVHEAGASIFLQIVHVGRELVSNTAFKFPGKAVGPSSLPHPLTGESCRELNRDEIYAIRDKFIRASQRAQEAGFDGLEIHGAHGYLLNQFVSPSSNRRVDEYGGSLENRIRFPLEVAEGVRGIVGKDFPISYRLNGNEFIENQMTLYHNESVLFAQELSRFVDLLHVSSGSGQTPRTTRTMIPLMSKPRGCYAHLSAAVKRSVPKPVISVGRITTPEVAEAILTRGDADMVAVGRGMIADPHWAIKAKQGRSNSIRRCISCNQGCMEYLVQERKITCLHNPAVGKERALAITPSPREKRKVLIIGGGVAGMEAARVAILRGHHVALWEKAERLGGNANFAYLTPWKNEFKGVLDYLLDQMKVLQVSLKLGTEGTVEKIIQFNPDAVILATGAKPRTLQVLRSAGTRVFSAEEALSLETGRVVSPVCVIGGGSVGLETAAYLKILGHDVVLIEMLHEIGGDLGPINKAFWHDKISELNIPVHAGCEVSGIQKDRLQLKEEGCLKTTEPFSSYVFAVGYEPENALIRALEQEKSRLSFQIYSIGDCASPRNALHAIREGFEVAHSL
jgi:2,4-dienoyl-CoA reductase-like NADH-dependent reductase (Old Yellow Enzyme family)/NADPH-dependent 2,4-dienoyl-CoA reductase/sulfur reductase-like enzyme